MVAPKRGVARIRRAAVAAMAIATVAIVALPHRPLIAADAGFPGSAGGRVTPRTVERDQRDPRRDPRRAAIALPDRVGRAVPTVANLRPPPPAITSPARAITSPVRPSASPVRAISSSVAVRSTAVVSASTAYRGHNHVWIPALGINRSVQSFPCSRSRPPDGGVYRWGCAGRNNVYLMSHAWSTFKPLHDAYVGGRLRTGMSVWYADGASRVHRYRVVWWRITAPTTAASWAWAAQSRPSMTLQTCVGARNQYRLMVRLLQVG